MENFDRKGIVMDYPTLERMMKDRAGKISREQFKAEFGKMQVHRLPSVDCGEGGMLSGERGSPRRQASLDMART